MIKKIFITLLLISPFFIIAQQNLSLMCYNILNFPGNTPERADTLKTIIDYTTPDILVVNELISEQGANLILSNALNVNSNSYTSATFINGNDSDNLIFYKSNKVTLYHQEQINTALRDISYYKLYINNIIGDTTWLNIFSCHFKSGNSNTEASLRNNEATILKNYLTSNNITNNVLVLGDFNFYSNFEDAYFELTLSGNTPLFDPVNREGLWHNNYNFRDVHTQSTRGGSTPGLGGGSWGGLDDRFDFIFVSEDVLDGNNNLKYINDTYIAVGQDANRFNGSINSNNISIPSSVSNALYYMSDHLPVYLELEQANYSAINENQNEYKFTQTHSFVTLSNNSSAKDIEYEIITIDGKSIEKGNIRNQIFSKDISSLSSGIYICIIKINKQTFTEHFSVY